MIFQTKIERNIQFNSSDNSFNSNNTNKINLNKFNSEIETEPLKLETKITKKENIMSAIKGGAIGYILMDCWFDMDVPSGPLFVTACFSAATIAMNYSQATRDFKEGFQKGVVIGTPIWIAYTNTAPGFMSISLITIGTIWGLCTCIKKKIERMRQEKKEDKNKPEN